MATEAVDLVRDKDVWTDMGDIVMDLAVVLRAAGHPEQASVTVQQALSLYEQKGNLVSADKARRILAEIGSQPKTAQAADLL